MSYSLTKPTVPGYYGYRDPDNKHFIPCIAFVVQFAAGDVSLYAFFPLDNEARSVDNLNGEFTEQIVLPE